MNSSFFGISLALDFLNTHPILNGESVEFLPDFRALLRWFQAADLLSPQEAANSSEAVGSIGLRPAGCRSHARSCEKASEPRSWDGSAVPHSIRQQLTN